jgi:hypothetical protein
MGLRPVASPVDPWISERSEQDKRSRTSGADAKRPHQAERSEAELTSLRGEHKKGSRTAAEPPSLYGVHCRCSCSLIVKEELNIFSLGLSPDLEAEEKMWWGVGRGLESAMRSRDDQRRQARTLFLANDADRGEPTNERDGLRCGRFPEEVSPPAVLKVNPCALDWRPRPGLMARTVSRGTSGVLEWTSKSVSSGSEARATD